ncbi:MAG: DsrE family protein [Pseudomonadota bacterium]
MSKVAIILHAEPGTHDALGRALHALLYSQELYAEGHDVRLVFDGGGTKWIEEFKKPDNKLAPMYEDLKMKKVIAAVCEFCIGAFDGDKALVEREGLPLVNEYNGHPSVAKLIAGGYQIITL